MLSMVQQKTERFHPHFVQNLLEAAADYAVALVQAGLDEGFAGLIAQWDVDTSNGALTCCLKRV